MKCPACGSMIPDGIRFCIECGKAIDPPNKVPESEPLKAAVLPEVVPADTYDSALTSPASDTGKSNNGSQSNMASAVTGKASQQPHQNSGKQDSEGRCAVMSTKAYVGSILLLSIPVIGLIIAVIWACGGARKQNHRNLAKAWLVLLVIAVILVAILIGVALVLSDALWPAAADSMDTLFGGNVSRMGIDSFGELFEAIFNGSIFAY